MPRIENELIESEIASSLLSPAEQELEHAQPEQRESEYAPPGDVALDEEVDRMASERYRMDHGDAAWEERYGGEEGKPETGAKQVRPEAQQEREPGQERTQPQEQQAQAQPPTAEEVQEGIRLLDAAVQEHGLNDAVSAKSFADEFCSAFGTDVYKAGVDVEKFGQVMAKTALSTVEIYKAVQGDLSQLPEIPADAARAFAHDILSSWGLDPRQMNVDASLLARTVQGGLFNFLNTYQRFGGKVTDLAKLNDPEASEFYFASFMKALGQEGPVNRTAALRFADSIGKYILSFLGRYGAAQDRTAPTQQTQPRGRGQRVQHVPKQFREGVKGSKAPQFRSNLDIFSPEAVAAATRQKL